MRRTVTIEFNGKQEKITADESVLNLLSMYATEAANRYETLGLNAIRKVAKGVGDDIYDGLAKYGYYGE